MNIRDITAGTVHHKTPPKRGETRCSDMTPQEVKDIIMQVADGSTLVMSTLTGLRADYYVEAVKGRFRISWNRADTIRNTLKDVFRSKGGTMTTKTTTAPYDLSDLDPTFKSQIEDMIANGTLVECGHCHKLVHRKVYYAGFCQTCTKAGNSKPVNRPPVTDKPKPKGDSIHTRPMLTCGNPECNRKFRDWRGRKHCDKVCAGRATYLRKQLDTETLAKMRTASVKEQTPKPTEMEGAHNGTPCIDPECGGVLNIRMSKFGLFYGCTWYLDENRPVGKRTSKHKCRSAVSIKQAGRLNGAAKPVATTPKPVAPKPVAAPLSQYIGEQVLHALKSLSAEVRDCLGQVSELRAVMQRNCENTGTLRKEFSDLDFKVDDIKESVDFLREQLG